MVVGGRTTAEPASCASCSGPLCCCCCCPSAAADVCAATLAGSGGMWSAQLRSPPPPGCGPDKQALFLVAFPICAAAAHHQHHHQQPPPPPTSSSCCCNCGWSAKPPSPHPPSWPLSTPLQQDLPADALPTWDQDERASSPGLRREEGLHHHHHQRMEAPPSPPLPTTHGVGHQQPLPSGAGGDLETDLSRVRDALRTLRASGYYYEGLSSEEANRLLRGCPVGTFLVRESSDNRFLFALSVQTESEPTSVRIHYRRGQFRLDCEDALSPRMPWFKCVVSLVEHYVQLSRSAKGKFVWIDCHGRRDAPVMLTRPLYREPASLQHLCRIALNRGAKPLAMSAYRAVEPLPAALKDYLRDYPHLH